MVKIKILFNLVIYSYNYTKYNKFLLFTKNTINVIAYICILLTLKLKRIEQNNSPTDKRDTHTLGLTGLPVYPGGQMHISRSSYILQMALSAQLLLHSGSVI